MADITDSRGALPSAEGDAQRFAAAREPRLPDFFIVGHPKCGTSAVYRMLKRAPAADEDFMLELRRRFKPEVEALSEYLDRDLVTFWGYDSLT
jgi:hypothetical protein